MTISSWAAPNIQIYLICLALMHSTYQVISTCLAGVFLTAFYYEKASRSRALLSLPFYY